MQASGQFQWGVSEEPGETKTCEIWHQHSCKSINAHNIICIGTSVSGALMKVYLLSSSMRAILASNRANLIPIHIRGPKPNGMWQSWGLLAFSSGVNLVSYSYIVCMYGVHNNCKSLYFEPSFLLQVCSRVGLIPHWVKWSNFHALLHNKEMCFEGP